MIRLTEEARAEIAKVPFFVRKMAQKAVESEVAKANREEVTVNDVRLVREKYIKFAEEEKDQSKAKPTRIAVVRCEVVSEVCPGVACFQAFNQRKIAFSEYGPETEFIGFFTCGGCPGRRVARLVEKLVPFGLDVVHLSSCMLLEKDYVKCPHWRQIKRSIEQKGIKVVEGTHH
ncbi:MAG: CGGC domain-containing protein [Syntrophomonadaceae bacterium]|nr:CGGC domain-containing protein [Syntrophomonadaceae bacterium]